LFARVGLQPKLRFCYRFMLLKMFPEEATIHDVEAVFFGGHACPFAAADPLADCRTKEQWRETITLLEAANLDRPLLLHERFPPMYGGANLHHM
jgi:hypothetical protein